MGVGWSAIKKKRASQELMAAIEESSAEDRALKRQVLLNGSEEKQLTLHSPT